MEKNKEAVKKSCSDIYTSKKVGVPKTDFLKNSAHLSIKSDAGRNKVSYISRSKNVSIPIDKKYNFYENEAKSFLKHSCEKCSVKTRPHLVVNSEPVNYPNEVPKIEPGHDLNGNVSFNAHPTLCNFASSVSEISTFNKVLSYQSNQHYEISISKSTKHKQRTVFPEQRAFNSKVSSSNNSFTANKFFSSMPNSTIRCHCSKNISQKFASTDSFPKGSDKSSQENIPITEKYNSKYTVKYANLPDQCLSKDGVKLSDLPVFVHSNLTKDPSLTCTVDYSENQFQAKKYSSSKKWDQISVSPEFVESSKNLEETEKMMLFPALPSNNHCQQVKLNSSCTNSLPASELSAVENSKLESVLSSSSGNVNLNSSTVTVTVPSTIPQASYADVIRMSTTCSGVQGYVALELDKTLNPEQNSLAQSSTNQPMQEKLPKDESPQPGSSDWVILRLSQIDLNSPDPVNNIALTNINQNGQNFVAPRPIVVSLEKPSFYNSSMQTCKNVLSALSSHTNLPPSDKKVAENDIVAVDCLSNSEKSSVDNSLISGSMHRSSVSSDFTTSMTDTQVASIKTDSVYSSPSSVSSFGDAFKQIEGKDLNLDGLLKKDPPVIIMNSCSPPDSMSEISFGIEYDEMLKLCSDSCSIIEDVIPLPVKDSSENSFSEKISNASNSHSNSQKLASEDVTTSKASEIKMPVNESISVKGKKICWEDSNVDFDRSNHVQLAEYFTGIWDKMRKDHETDSGQTNGNVQYYHEL